MPGKARSNP